MKQQITIAFLVFCLALPSSVRALEGLPGSTWGDFHWELPDDGRDNLILEGWVRQGMAWKKWQKNTASLLLTTYITARYKWDSRGYDWNNYLGPGIGTALELYNPEGPLLSWGVEHIYQMNYRSGGEDPYTALYMNWYDWWGFTSKEYPGSTWGDLRWEIPNSGSDNLILEGWVKQGKELSRWKKGGNDFILNPFVKVRFKWDSESLDWNNYIAPGAGISVDMESEKGPLISYGTEYVWEKRFRSGDDVHRIDFFVRWYAWWDLAKKEAIAK
jgi:hypothetical protein